MNKSNQETNNKEGDNNSKNNEDGDENSSTTEEGKKLPNNKTDILSNNKNEGESIADKEVGDTSRRPVRSIAGVQGIWFEDTEHSTLNIVIQPAFVQVAETFVKSNATMATP